MSDIVEDLRYAEHVIDERVVKVMDAGADEIESLRQQLETERIRLAACGVVALSDTPESAAKARDMHPDYQSASCKDVARRVDECIALRQQLAEKDAEIERLNKQSANRLIGVCKAGEDNDRLRLQLSDSQAREQQLREALIDAEQSLDILWVSHHANRTDGAIAKAREALAMPQDTSALEAMIAKAGEVMRERCRKVAFDMAYADSMAVDVSQTIRALPGVTLEDLK